MAGTFITPMSKEPSTIDGVGGTGIIGAKSSIFFDKSMDGQPRRDNLFAVRLLGQTIYLEWIKDVIKKQVVSTDFNVHPTVDEDQVTDRHIDAAESIEDFWRGNWNTDRKSFDDFLNPILEDVLDMNAGPVELVPDDQGFLKEVIVRDGLTFTKNVKDNGKLPVPGSGEPAYFQFSLSSHAHRLLGTHNDGIDLRNLEDELFAFPFRIFSRKTRKFSRSRICWFSENDVSYSAYGRGRTQKVKKAVEVLLNGDIHRNRFFKDNEFHKGILQIAEASQREIQNLKDVMDDSKGDEHQLPVIGGTEANFISIDPNPEQMQFLESHKWYTKLVLMAYGLNESEAGLHENANLSVSDEMKFNIWRRTTQPLLKMIERKINNQILPFMREYHAVDGEIEFVFEPENRFLKKMEQEIEQNELKMGTTTINELRQKRGKEGFGAVGNLPQNVFDNLAQQLPGWVAEQVNDDIEDVPDPSKPGGGLLQFIQPDDDKNGGSGSPVGDQTDNDDGDDGGGRNFTPEQATTYKDLFDNIDECLQHTKDALRNEPYTGEFPPLKQHKDDFKASIADQFQKIGREIKKAAEEEFPEEDVDGHVLVDADTILDDVEFTERLRTQIEKFNLDALEESAEFHKDKVEAELEDEERSTSQPMVKVDISFDIMDTITARLLKQDALQSATEIEDAVKDQIKTVLLNGAEEGQGIDKITQAIEEKVDDISRNHAELVARTETLSTSRKGSQALAEGTDLIAGKEWEATDDNRTRTWHAVMDGTIVPKDDSFVVPQTSDDKQPSSYPRSARVVGQDQPYNCRCAQLPVLREDMPEDLRMLREWDGVSVELQISERKYEVWLEHGKDGESFEDMWRRITDKYSVSEIIEHDIVGSNTTIYNWNDEVGINQ